MKDRPEEMRKIEFKAWDSEKEVFTNFMIVDNVFKFMDKFTGVWFRDDEQKRFKLLQNTDYIDENGKELTLKDKVKGFIILNYHCMDFEVENLIKEYELGEISEDYLDGYLKGVKDFKDMLMEADMKLLKADEVEE